MKIFLTLALLTVLSGCASSPSTWSKETRYSEYTYQALHAVDLIQTLDIKNHPDVHESNFLLGEHPSDKSVAVWYVGTAVLHGAVTSILVEDESTPRWICRTWEVLTIGETVSAIHGNYKLGLKVGF